MTTTDNVRDTTQRARGTLKETVGKLGRNESPNQAKGNARKSRMPLSSNMGSVEVNAPAAVECGVKARSIMYHPSRAIKRQENSILFLLLIVALFGGLGFALPILWIVAAIFFAMCVGAIGGVMS